jgi:hypothetical protein
MGHQVAYLAAAGGKHLGSKANTLNGAFPMVRRLVLAAAVLLAASIGASPSHAQSGPFAGIAGNWAGGGGGNFEVVASTAGFNANISLRTAGNKQSINMRADSTFRGAAISMSR